jgi:hypothetical protein
MNKDRELDQFYTNPEYAKQVLNTLNIEDYDYILEPSVGTGSFYNLLDPNKRIGVDIDPKIDDVLTMDFLKYYPPIFSRIYTVGNPPFGKNSSLAVKFFNHASQFSDTIAFILPRTFRKDSIINSLDPYFHLVSDIDVPKNSFIFKGEVYDVPCCFQIWEKRNIKRERKVIYKLSDLKEYFERVDPELADFSIQRVGYNAGKILTSNFHHYSPENFYFIKAHKDFVLDVFRQIDFKEVKSNTAGFPSVSPSELVHLYIKHGGLKS